MGFTTIEIKKSMVRAIKLDMKVKDVTNVFDVSRKTV